MGYYPTVEAILCTPKRKKLLEIRRSFRSSLGLIIVATFLTAIVVAYTFASYPNNELALDSWVVKIRLLALIPLPFILEVVRRYYNDLYQIGRDRITHYKGRVSFFYSTPSLKCVDLRAISVSQGLLGRILDYGDLALATAGHEGPELILKGIRAPNELSSIVEELRQQSQQDTEDRIGEQLATIRALNDD